MNARIQPLAPRQRSLVVRLCNLLARRRFGREIDSLNIIARSPGLFMPYLLTSQLAREKQLSHPQRDHSSCSWWRLGMAAAGVSISDWRAR